MSWNLFQFVWQSYLPCIRSRHFPRNMDFMKVVKSVNNFNYKDACIVHSCIPFCVEDKDVGIITPAVLREISHYPEVFVIQEKTVYEKKKMVVCLNNKLKTVQQRDTAVANVLEDLRRNKKFKCLNGWRNERYSIYADRAAEPLLHMERSACCLFGVLEYGVHINGYTYQNSSLKMWIGRRAMTKSLYPGLYDQMCAGGLSEGLGIRECAIKECQEEASLDDKTLEKLKSVGALSYCFEDDIGIHAETEYIFDLELPPDFEPRNADGEVDNFFLFSMDELAKLIQEDKFKPNCAIVVLDFLMRHGIITHDNEPRYLNLVEQLHVPLQPQM